MILQSQNVFNNYNIDRQMDHIYEK